MFEEIKVNPVSKRTFRAKMKDLEPALFKEMNETIFLEREYITKYMYGRIPGKRIYRILLEDGSIIEWKAKKKNQDY